MFSLRVAKVDPQAVQGRVHITFIYKGKMLMNEIIPMAKIWTSDYPKLLDKQKECIEVQNFA